VLAFALRIYRFVVVVVHVRGDVERERGREEERKRRNNNVWRLKKREN